MDNTRPANQEVDLDALRALQADTSKLVYVENLLDRFNVFEAIGFVGQEVKHSYFLAFLLNPKQNHDLGDFFLKRLLRKALASADGKLPPSIEDLDEMDLDETLVHRERHNIDLLLTNENHRFAVIIENKVWSTEHSDQLNRYHQVVRKGHPGWRVFGIYQTPHGDSPSHEAYSALSYGTVCEILDGVLEDRISALTPDVRMSIEHYKDMVRRNVLGDPEIARLCQQIYRRHKRALDLVYKHRPDAQAQIRSVLEALIRDDPNFKRDSRAFGNFILRFAVTKWDTPALLAANGWTGSGRILLFEFWNHPDRLDLKLILGPGADEVRRKLLDMVRNNGHVFDFPRNYVASFYEVWSRTLLNRSMYEDTNQEEREQEIRRQWTKFLDEDLPRIQAALKEEAWIWESVETEDST